MKKLHTFLLIAILCLFVSQLAQAQKAVDKEKLKALLPTTSLAGYERDEPEGQQVNMSNNGENFSFSEATVTYQGSDNAEITVTIFDYIHNEMQMNAFCSPIAMEMDYSSDYEYVKSVTTGKHRGFEQWSHQKNRETEGTLAYCIEGRFVVSVSGSNIKDTSILKKLLANINLDKVAALASH